MRTSSQQSTGKVLFYSNGMLNRSAYYSAFFEFNVFHVSGIPFHKFYTPTLSEIQTSNNDERGIMSDDSWSASESGFIRYHLEKFITQELLLWLNEIYSIFSHFNLTEVFFHLPTGFYSSRSTINKGDPACGIGWWRGARPNPEALRATERECAWEREETVCAGRGGRH